MASDTEFGEAGLFEIGDKVVYPHHGAGTVVKKEKREILGEVREYLTSGGTEMPKNWNRRFKHNRDKMKTGDIFELAEVVRNLALRDGEKGLSTGEKQMYVKAKKILASELMYAKGLDEEEAAAWLEEVLAGATKKKPGPAAKAKATAAA